MTLIKGISISKEFGIQNETIPNQNLEKTTKITPQPDTPIYLFDLYVMQMLNVR